MKHKPAWPLPRMTTATLSLVPPSAPNGPTAHSPACSQLHLRSPKSDRAGGSSAQSPLWLPPHSGGKPSEWPPGPGRWASSPLVLSHWLLTHPPPASPAPSCSQNKPDLLLPVTLLLPEGLCICSSLCGCMFFPPDSHPSPPSRLRSVVSISEGPPQTMPCKTAVPSPDASPPPPALFLPTALLPT